MMNAASQKLEFWPIERLRPYERNPRKNDHAVVKMAEIIRRFGFRIPVLAKSDGEIADGHLRYKAAMYLGLTEVPVIPCDDLSPSEIRALRIAINRAAELAEWDEDLLREEMSTLDGIDPEEMGFDDFDLRDLEYGLGDFEMPEVSTPLADARQEQSGQEQEKPVASHEQGRDETQKLADSKYSVLVECTTEGDQQELLERLAEEGYTCRALIS